MISVFKGSERRLGQGQTNDFFVKLEGAMLPHLHKFKGAPLSVFIALGFHINQEGWAWPSFARLCVETGLNKNTIGIALNYLAKLDLDGGRVMLAIACQNKNGKNLGNAYLFCPSPEEVAAWLPYSPYVQGHKVYTIENGQSPKLPINQHTENQCPENEQPENQCPEKQVTENQDLTRSMGDNKNHEDHDVASATPSPPASQKKEKPKTETNPNYQPMYDALLTACSINGKTASGVTRINLGKMANKLIALAVTPDRVLQFRQWWNANDWRGKKGEAPSLTHLGDSWQQFTESTQPKQTDIPVMPISQFNSLPEFEQIAYNLKVEQKQARIDYSR